MGVRACRHQASPERSRWDHTRIAFSAIYPDETRASVLHFLQAALACYERLGIRFAAVLTDNGVSHRSHAFAHACRAFGLKHRRTRPYIPRTNGKAERFIQTALREWAHARTYQNSAERQTPRSMDPPAQLAQTPLKPRSVTTHQPSRYRSEQPVALHT